VGESARRDRQPGISRQEALCGTAWRANADALHLQFDLGASQFVDT